MKANIVVKTGQRCESIGFCKARVAPTNADRAQSGGAGEIDNEREADTLISLITPDP
jgi:hypothetical protein